MALNPEDSLTYNDLLILFKSWVKSNCNNVGSYSAAVDVSLKSGFSRRYSYQSNNVTKYATLLINSWDVVPVVTESTIDSQIDEFFTSRNIIQRKDFYVTTSGIINFWNNLAIFCNKRLYLVASQYAPNPILMYNSGTVKAFDPLDNLTDTNSIQKESVVPSQDFITIAKAFDSALVDFAKEKYVIYAVSLS